MFVAAIFITGFRHLVYDSPNSNVASVAYKMLCFTISQPISYFLVFSWVTPVVFSIVQVRNKFWVRTQLSNGIIFYITFIYFIFYLF